VRKHAVSKEVLWSRFVRWAAGQGTSFQSVPIETTLCFGARPPRHFMYFAKQAFFSRMQQENLMPKDWLVAIRPWFPNREPLQAVRALSRSFKLPVVFVGDLRPMELTWFAALRMGTADFSQRNRIPLQVRYGGIDDRWLEIADEFRLPHATERQWPMDSFECEHYDVLKKLMPDLEQLVGERCYALLEARQVFMMEMSWAGGEYREGYFARLVEHLAARGASLPSRSGGSRRPKPRTTPRH